MTLRGTPLRIHFWFYKLFLHTRIKPKYTFRQVTIYNPAKGKYYLGVYGRIYQNWHILNLTKEDRLPQNHRRHQEETKLILACQSGQAGAREKLIEHYQAVVEGHVTNLLHRYKCTHLIAEHRDEIVQQIWTELFNQINRFPPNEFPSWFAFLRRWRTLDYIRKEIHYKQHHSNLNPDHFMHARAASDSNQQPSPEESIQRKELRLEIKICQKQLPRRQRNFIEFFYFQGLSYKQIAAQFGIQESSIGTIHTRSLRNLKKLLKKRQK